MYHTIKHSTVTQHIARALLNSPANFSEAEQNDYQEFLYQLFSDHTNALYEERKAKAATKELAAATEKDIL